MTVLVERPYLQQNAETLQNVMKALTEGMVFIASPKNKPAVLETITKQFKMTDTVAAEGAYQDVVTLVRMEEYRKALCLHRSHANLATPVENAEPENRRHQSGKFD